MSDDHALVLAAHGSHHDPASSAPVSRLADRLRERGDVGPVRAAFWKEQPSLAEVLETVDAPDVTVVPVTTAGGYFTERVFPRELGLDDPTPSDRAVTYTEPVGTHPHVADLVAERAHAVVDGEIDDTGLGLGLVGHGTDRHARSADATLAHVDRLRRDSRFVQVEAAFLDETPGLDDLLGRLPSEAAVVVPLFVANGHHVRCDIPTALGLPPSVDPFGGPHRVDGRRLWYAEAVGTAPGLADIVRDRVAAPPVEPSPAGGRRDGGSSAAASAFLRWFVDRGGPSGAVPSGGATEGDRRWGELLVAVEPTDDGTTTYTLRHVADSGVPTASLDRIRQGAELRRRTRHTDLGPYRPLRTARTLPRGWYYETNDRRALVRAVSAVYPASIEHWAAARTGRLEPTSFEAVVDRQVGRYRDLDTLDDDTLERTVAACCGDCVRRRAWAAEALDAPPEPGSFPCPEPCSYLLEAARTFHEASPDDGETAPDPSVPAAAFSRPGNRTRVRFDKTAWPAVTNTEEPTPEP